MNIYIPEGPKEMELEIPPSLLLKTSTQQREVAVATHSFSVS